MLSKMGLDLQCHFGVTLIDFCKFDLVRMITRHGFQPETPFFHSMGWEFWKHLIPNGSIALDFEDVFGLNLIELLLLQI